MFVQSVDWIERLVIFDANVLDVPLVRTEIRTIEASEEGIVFDTIITAGGQQTIGAGQDALTITLTNNYEAEFTGTGERSSSNGNFIGRVRPTPGIFFERELSLAFASTAAPLSAETEQAIRDGRDHARAANMQTKPIQNNPPANDP